MAIKAKLYLFVDHRTSLMFLKQELYMYKKVFQGYKLVPIVTTRSFPLAKINFRERIWPSSYDWYRSLQPLSALWCWLLHHSRKDLRWYLSNIYHTFNKLWHTIIVSSTPNSNLYLRNICCFTSNYMIWHIYCCMIFVLVK